MACSSSSYVGEDVVIDILKRLPVKCLLRFRCVCKSWYALIKGSYFVSKHELQQNHAMLMNENNAPDLFVTSREKFVSWISSSSLLEEIPSTNPTFLPFFDGGQISTIMGPVNGIYCVISFKEELPRVFLCNPSLREVKAMPEIPKVPLVENNSNSKYEHIFGFGYDTKINDFKVVLIRRMWRRPFSYFVHTLSNNSWKRVTLEQPYGLPTGPPYTRPGVFVSRGNGAVHWLARYGRRSEVILSFDLGTEVFRMLPQSKEYCWLWDERFQNKASLTVFNGSIVVIWEPVRCGPQEERHFEIWMMNKEIDTAKMWYWSVKKCWRIGPFPGVMRLLKICKNDKFLLCKSEGQKTQLVSYDLNSKQIKNLDLDISESLQVLTYMESLVSIKDHHEELIK